MPYADELPYIPRALAHRLISERNPFPGRNVVSSLVEGSSPPRKIYINSEVDGQSVFLARYLVYRDEQTGWFQDGYEITERVYIGIGRPHRQTKTPVADPNKPPDRHRVLTMIHPSGFNAAGRGMPGRLVWGY
jgi:hypothetical protein